MSSRAAQRANPGSRATNSAAPSPLAGEGGCAKRSWVRGSLSMRSIEVASPRQTPHPAPKPMRSIGFLKWTAAGGRLCHLLPQGEKGREPWTTVELNRQHVIVDLGDGV